MIDVAPHLRLRDIAVRSIAVSHKLDSRERIRSIVDAAEGDARMGGQGVAVCVEITTDPAMAPVDVSGESVTSHDIFNGGPLCDF